MVGRRSLLAALVALALVAGSAAVAAPRHRDEPGWPDGWDPRVAPLVDFVEGARGRRFEHPVRVYFLSDEEYRRVVTGEGTDPTDEEREEAAAQVAMLRALGLVEGDPDLLASSDSIADSGTLAFYDTDADVVNVRGSELTPALRATLVHELTHAWQDQHFDVADLIDHGDGELASAVRSVVEGDAGNVEQLYVAEVLDEEEASDLVDQTRADVADAETDLEDVPDFLTASFGAPYYLGPPFVRLFGSTSDGTYSPDRVDRLLDDPPTTMGHLFDPLAWRDEVAAATVDHPELDGLDDLGDAFDRSSIGAVALYAMLATRIDPAAALTAVDGWRGDAYTAAEVGEGDDARMCVAAEVAVASDDDGDELRAALDEWAATLPTGSDVEIGGTEQTATVRACDPGPDADLSVAAGYTETLLLPAVRLQLTQNQVASGASFGVAACVADAVVRELTLEDLAAEELTPELERRVTDLIAAAIRDC